MADDIKRDADLQRQSAPQPRDKGDDDGGILDNINEKLAAFKNNYEQAVVGELTAYDALIKTNFAGFNKLSDAFHKMSSELIEGSSLKEIENQKEAAKRVEQTNDLLETIADNTEKQFDAIAPKGFVQKALAGLGLIIGGLIGIVVGFGAGLGEFIKKSVAPRVLNSITGLFKIIGKSFSFLGNTLLKRFPSLQIIPDKFNQLKNFFGKQIKTITNFATKVGVTFRAFFDSILAPFKKGPKQLAMFKTGGFITQVGESFQRFTKLLGNAAAAPFRLTRNIIRDLTAPFESIAKAFGGSGLPRQGPGVLKGIRKTIATTINPFFTFFKTGLTAFANFGRTLGRIFLPLTVLFGIIDTITGVIAGVKDEGERGGSKLLAGIIGGLKGFLVGFVALPLDFLKNAFTFIIRKLFGIDKENPIIKAITNFSFQDIFKLVFDRINSFAQSILSGMIGIVDSIGNFITSIPDKFMNMISSIIETVVDGIMLYRNIQEKIQEVIKSIVRSILPDPTAGGLKGVAAKAFNAFGAYEYAGVDYKTGELIPPSTDVVGAGSEQGEELIVESNTNRRGRRGGGVSQQAVIDSSIKQSRSQQINVSLGNSSQTARGLRFQDDF